MSARGGVTETAPNLCHASAVVIVSRAPVRIADLGAWSDTWFAKSGVVSNVAVSPGLTVTLRPDPSLEPDQVRVVSRGEVAIETVSSKWNDELLGLLFADAPVGQMSVTIDSSVPPGSGLGTSAALAVAVVAAIDTLKGRPPVDQWGQLDVARRAHQRETATGRQSGVQDHAAAALGGVHRWAIHYPSFVPTEPLVDDRILQMLEERLLTVYLGTPHESSQLHEMVIRELESADDGGRDADALLAPLRVGAEKGHHALLAGDLAAYGQAMVACHEGQRRLHRELIGDLADHVVSSVALGGAAGWKVNGAGGAGGSITILCGPEPTSRRKLIEIVTSIDGAEVLDLRINRTGVEVETFGLT